MGRSRVAQLQRYANLSADGVVGSNTWAKLVDWSSRNVPCAQPKPSGYSIDTAKYQHPGGVPINWAAVRASGVEFAIVEATRGVNITDEYLTTDLDAAWTAGLAVAPYHFYTGSSANTGAAQADWFIAAVRTTGYSGHRAGDLPPVFDLERVDDGSGRCPVYGTVDGRRAVDDLVATVLVDVAHGQGVVVLARVAAVARSVGVERPALRELPAAEVPGRDNGTRVLTSSSS